jgi:hypothetical protein
MAADAYSVVPYAFEFTNGIEDGFVLPLARASG